MNRGELTNIQWKTLPPLLPPQKPKTGRPAHEHRTIIGGILWILRTGAPWRDLPKRYGPWRTVASRFYHWRRAGIWERLLNRCKQVRRLATRDKKGAVNYKAMWLIAATIVWRGIL